MNEKLIVKNFGPIKDAELELKKVTVFIGPQGSGKSTLAKLVALCRNSDFLTDSYIGKDRNSHLDKYQLQFLLRPDSYFNLLTKKFLFEFSETSSDFKISDFSEMTGELFGQLSQTTFHTTFNSMKDSYKHYLEGLKQIQGNYKTLYPMSEKIVRQIITQLNETQLNRNAQYISSDRLLISSISDSIFGLLSADVALQKSTLSFGGDFEIARSKIPTLFIDYLNVTYKFENGRNFVYHNETDFVPLSASASGYQSTIPLHLTVEHFSKKGGTHFIVEEGEMNLFPTAIKQLIGYLADKCTQNGNELLMTTHSPYVLTALNNLIFAYQVAQVLPERAEDIAQIIPKE